MNFKYNIDKKKCVNCKMCAQICTVYDVVTGKSTNNNNNEVAVTSCEEVTIVNPNLCIECGHCQSVCPKGAITGPYEVEDITKECSEVIPDSEALLNLLKTRRSIRRYKSTPIKQEDLEKILLAAQTSPTGTNAQDVKMVIVNNKEVMDNLKEELLPSVYKMFGFASKLARTPLGNVLLGKIQAKKMRDVYGPAMEVFKSREEVGEDRLFYNAPALMITYGEKQDEAIGFSSHIAMSSCMLMAETLGIGTLLNSFALMAINQNPKLKEKLGIPKECKCFGAMCLGYKNISYKKHVHRDPVEVKYVDSI